MKNLVGAAGLEPATLGLEGRVEHYFAFTSNHIFHKFTPVQGICFRSAQNPFYPLYLGFWNSSGTVWRWLPFPLSSKSREFFQSSNRLKEYAEGYMRERPQ